VLGLPPFGDYTSDVRRMDLALERKSRRDVRDGRKKPGSGSGEVCPCRGPAPVRPPFVRHVMGSRRARRLFAVRYETYLTGRGLEKACSSCACKMQTKEFIEHAITHPERLRTVAGCAPHSGQYADAGDGAKETAS